MKDLEEEIRVIKNKSGRLEPLISLLIKDWDT